MAGRWLRPVRVSGCRAMKTIRTATLEIAYEESGRAAGRPVILLHGFPDDVHAYDEVAPPLAALGWRVFVPYRRGYGPTRFLDDGTPRSGQQAALGRDLADFMDALGLERAVLAGYDWGGRAACIVAALWPQRAAGLVLSAATTSRTSPRPQHRLRPRPSTDVGTNGTSTPSADGRDWRRTGARCAGCSGHCGRPITALTIRLTNKPQRHSTIRISSRW